MHMNMNEVGTAINLYVLSVFTFEILKSFKLLAAVEVDPLTYDTVSGSRGKF